MRTLLAALILIGLASPASAECRVDDKQPVSYRMQVIDGRPTLVIDTEIIVCGHPARPAVAYVVSAKAIDYAWQALEYSMVPSLLASLGQLTGGSR
jgi:hypothetical protein